MNVRAVATMTLLLLLGACEPSAEHARVPPYAADTSADPPPPEGGFVHVFLVDTQPRNDPAAARRIGCGDRIVPIAVHTRSDDLTGAIRALLAQPDTLGLENVLYQNGGLSLDSVVTREGTARVFFSGRVALRGVCDHPRLANQLQATARSSTSADSVAFFINGEPLEQWMSLR